MSLQSPYQKKNNLNILDKRRTDLLMTDRLLGAVIRNALSELKTVACEPCVVSLRVST